MLAFLHSAHDLVTSSFALQATSLNRADAPKNVEVEVTNGRNPIRGVAVHHPLGHALGHKLNTPTGFRH